MLHLKSMLPALALLALQGGAGLFAQGNGMPNHGIGGGMPAVRPPMWGHFFPGPPGAGLGIQLGSMMLLPAAGLPADTLSMLPLPAGTDPLKDGRVNVRAAGNVAVTLRGAVASQSYDVWFCHFSLLPDRCSKLGSAQTDSNGDLSATLDFLNAGSSAAGIFAVSGGGAVQYVGGYMLASGPVMGTPILLEGTVASVNDAASSFLLQNTPTTITVDGSTTYKGVTGLGALAVGKTVLIHGYLQPDGTVYAALVMVM